MDDPAVPGSPQNSGHQSSHKKLAAVERASRGEALSGMREREVRAEEELRRANRALRMLSDSNQALIRVMDEAALLAEVCRIVIDMGGYCMAWVTYAERDAQQSLRVAAQRGFAPGLLESIELTWAERGRGLGPVGVAIRTGQPIIARKLSTEPNDERFWREAYFQSGYEAVIALPLMHDGKSFGALCVHAASIDAFDEEEIKILAELAGDLAFGLMALHARAEHEKAEELLHRREQEFRAFVENSPDLIVRFDRELRETYVNPALCRALGMPAEAFLNKRYGTPTQSAGRPPNKEGMTRVQLCIQSVFDTGKSATLDTLWPTPTGQRHYSGTYFPEVDRAGAVTSVICIARDITDYKLAEEGMIAREREFRTLAENSPDLITRYDRSRYVRYVNRAVEKLCGLPAAKIVGLLAGEHVGKRGFTMDPAELAKLHRDIDGVFTTGTPVEWDAHLQMPAGVRVVNVKLVPEIDELGNVVSVLSVGRDVTALKRADLERLSHLWFFESMDKVNRAIQGAASLEQMMGDVLDELLAIFRCDRAWLAYPCDPTESTWHVPMERTRPEYPGGFALNREFPIDAGVAEVMSLLREKRRPIRFGPGLDHPVSRIITDEHGVKTFLAMALFPSADKAYMFGLHQCSHQRVWSDDDVKLFQEIGRRLTDALTGLIARRKEQESERRQRLALQVGRIGTFEMSLATGRGTWSPEVTELWGFPPDFDPKDFGAYCWAHIHADDSERIRNEFTEKIKGGEGGEMEFRIVRSDGATRWIRWRGQVLTEPGENTERVLGMNMDITSEKQARAALEKSEREFRALAENTPDFILRWNRDLRRLYVNPAFASAVGATPDQLIGEEIGTNYSATGPELKESIELVREAVKRVFISGQPTEILIPWTTATGQAYHLIRYIPEFDGSGKLVTVLGIGRDVTAIKESEDRLRALTENSPDLIGRYDREHRALFVNRTIEKFFEIPASQLLGRRVGESSPKLGTELGREDTQRLRLAMTEVFATAKPVEIDMVLKFSGRETIMNVRTVPEFDESGQVVTVLNIGRDVTAQKQAEKAQALFRALIDHTTDAIEVIDPETGRFLDVNEAACKAHGYTREEYLARAVRDLDPPIDASPESWKRTVDEIRRQKSNIQQSQHRRKDGSIFPVEVNASYVRLDRDYLVAIVRDITERVRAQTALAESRLRLQAILDHSPVAIYMKDLEGRYLLVNRFFWRNRPAETSPIGLTDRDLISDRSVAARLRDVEDEIIRKGEPSAFEVSVEETDGRHDYMTVKFPMWDASGKLTGTGGIATDVTERNRLEVQFRQSQKMDAVGQLAAGIAHDFNNLLAVIQMEASLMLQGFSPYESPEEGLRGILAASNRAGNLTRQLLTFSRREVKQAKEIDLGEVIKTMGQLLNRVLGEDIAFECAITPDLPLIVADPGMMEQVLMNLSVNARDAMPSGGRLAINLSAVDIPAKRAAAYPGAGPGRHLCLAVTDTGCGIPPENLSRIFEPFFTTKEVGKGTGLGLATVFGIVQQHNGWLEVSSEVGRGTTFSVFLPALANSIRTSAPTPESLTFREGSEMILVVEDEPRVRALTEKILKKCGYRVITAESAVAARQISNEQIAAVDLLITDLVMPGGVSGKQLAESVIAIKPSMKVLFMSGFSNDIVNRQLPLGVGCNFLQKPYSASDLSNSVRRILDEPAKA